MDNEKDTKYYLNQILNDIVFVMRHMEGVSLEEFTENELLNNSVCFRLIQISENARKVKEDDKKKFSAIPWNRITALRNRIVHDYGHVVLDIIYDTACNDLPDLYQRISRVDEEDLQKHGA